jgi:F-type H+-transporting ATPase subunit alpha
MEEQVVALYAGVNGYLDDIPTEDVPRFQDELREELRTQGDIYKSIRESGDLTDEVSEQINQEIDKVKGRFQTSEDQRAA